MTQAWNLITTFQLIALIYGTGDGRKVEVTQFQEYRKEEVYGEVLYKFTNIQKQKPKKHIFQIKMTTSFIWQKVVYT